MALRVALVVLWISAATAVAFWRHAERTRVIEGVWIHMFEGSSFFENADGDTPCRLIAAQFEDAGWLYFHPDGIHPDGDSPLRTSARGLITGPEHELEAYELRFVGHKLIKPWGTGHMGLWKSDYTIDRLISATPLSGVRCGPG